MTDITVRDYYAMQIWQLINEKFNCNVKTQFMINEHSS